MMTRNTRKFELKLGRIGVILFLLGMSGLLFGVFLLGVTVGKNIDAYPEKIARFLPERIKTLTNRLSKDATEPAVVMRDGLKQEKPEPGGMALQKAPAEAVKEKPSPHATRPVDPKHPGPVDAVPKEPPIKERSAEQGKFMVQVVSYREKSKAEKLVKKISGMGYPVRTELTEVPEKGKWYRVVMGEFSSRPEAQAAVDDVSGKNKGLNCVIRSVEATGN
ncbi:MAG: hypothetical protein C0394_00985 [Syntrophus sp. (in: bacteria)]|nr:hypothetical protein [Syntrophus sp. (in: bacteria)]